MLRVGEKTWEGVGRSKKSRQSAAMNANRTLSKDLKEANPYKLKKLQKQDKDRGKREEESRKKVEETKRLCEQMIKDCESECNKKMEDCMSKCIEKFKECHNHCDTSNQLSPFSLLVLTVRFEGIRCYSNLFSGTFRTC